MGPDGPELLHTYSFQMSVLLVLFIIQHSYNFTHPCVHTYKHTNSIHFHGISFLPYCKQPNLSDTDLLV